VVVETNGVLSISAELLRGLKKGPQAGSGCTDGGQNTQNTKDQNDPHSKLEFLLQPDRKHQKKQGWKDDGKTKLAYPHQKIQNFHNASGAVFRMKLNIIIPKYYTVVLAKIQYIYIYQKFCKNLSSIYKGEKYNLYNFYQSICKRFVKGLFILAKIM